MFQAISDRGSHNIAALPYAEQKAITRTLIKDKSFTLFIPPAMPDMIFQADRFSIEPINATITRRDERQLSGNRHGPIKTTYTDDHRVSSHFSKGEGGKLSCIATFHYPHTSPDTFTYESRDVTRLPIAAKAISQRFGPVFITTFRVPTGAMAYPSPNPVEEHTIINYRARRPASITA